MSTATLHHVSALHPPSTLPHNTPLDTTPSGDVLATLNYMSSTTTDGELPYYYVEEPTTGPQHNLSVTPSTVTIRDLRGLEPDFHLDKQAFQPIHHPSTEKSFTDDQRITSTYYTEVQDLIKKHVPGAYEVVIFDHTIRRKDTTRTPVMRVHIDQSHEASYLRIKQHLPAERAEEVIKSGERVRIINVWRPINGPVVDSPLAFADSRSVDEEDVVPVRHIYPDREGATLAVRHKQEQEWWYWSGMRDEEVLLIKCFDTDTVVGGGAPGRRGRTPHTAFEHPGTPEEKRNSRASIEVRCLVIG